MFPEKKSKKNKQLHEKHDLGFWYSILSGYGINDKYITILVLSVLILVWFIVVFFQSTIIDFWGLTKFCGASIALSFIALYFINKRLVLQSEFWQHRVALMLFTPAFLVCLFALNKLIIVEKSSIIYTIKPGYKYRMIALENGEGFENNFHHSRVYDFKEFIRSGNGLKNTFEVDYNKGVLGYYSIADVHWVD